MTVAARFHSVVPYHGDGFGLGGVRSPAEYRALFVEYLQGAENAGLSNVVIYNFANALDPWAVATEILHRSAKLEPIVSVVTHHEHPFAAARRVSALTYMHGRRVSLNIVSGASASERRALGEVDKERSRRRITEYATVIASLLDGKRVTHEGEFFTLSDVELSPAVPSELRPVLFSPASLATGTATVPAGIDAPLLMSKPVSDVTAEVTATGCHRAGMIVGIVARADEDEAWNIARADGGAGRREQLAAHLQMQDNVSTQHARNVAQRAAGEIQDERLWYGSARHGTDCPKLVGNYEQVAGELARYVEQGVTDVIIDLPPHSSEYEHIGRVLGAVGRPTSASVFSTQVEA
jgi:alkanesulfonate monooxygenase